MTVAPKTLWLVGSPQGELVAARAWLAAQPALQLAEAHERPPAAAVVFQNRPGEIKQAALEALHRQAPLARIILLTGPLCDGELRSGQPLVGVERVSWLRWPLVLPQLCEPAHHSPPRTLSLADQLDLAARAGPAAPTGLRVEVVSHSAESAAALGALLKTLGYVPAWRPAPRARETPQPAAEPALGEPALVEPAPAVIVIDRDACPLTPAAIASLGPAPKVWLAAFARPEEAAAARAAGCCAIVPLPLLACDLRRALVIAQQPQ